MKAIQEFLGCMCHGETTKKLHFKQLDLHLLSNRIPQTMLGKKLHVFYFVFIGNGDTAAPILQLDCFHNAKFLTEMRRYEIPGMQELSQRTQVSKLPLGGKSQIKIRYIVVKQPV